MLPMMQLAYQEKEEMGTRVGVEMGITAEASQGAIFKSLLLQSVNCLVFLRSLYFLKIYIFT